MCDFKIITQNKHTVKITQEQSGTALLCHFAFTFDEAVSPALIEICWPEADRQYYSAYTPGHCGTMSLTPNWAPCHVGSAMCLNMPFMALLDRRGECLYTAALSDVVNPTEIAFGYVEETDLAWGRVRLFTAPSRPMKEYAVTLRIEKRENALYDACQEAVAWWRSLGYGNDYLPEAAFEPVYSSWYCFHQKLDEEELLAECTLAASLGMKTLIIDDGWQTDDNNRGYAYCGDWRVAKSKFKDFPAFVEKLHALGIKVMLWYSVPFVGDYSDAYERFKDKFLHYEPGGHTGVLDPRYKEVRDYLTDIYAKALTEYGIDGFKLDFIDSFHNYGKFVHNEEMDCYSVEDGASKLLEEIQSKLQAINKDVLIEFRQAYYGPVIGKYANMLRVGDCPGNIYRNLSETVRMRCFTDGAAVHSDMLTCNAHEPVEAFLSQFFAVFFSVPQFSYKLLQLSEEKLKALRFYLGFHNAHRELLLHGRLKISGADRGVTKLESFKDGEQMVLLYREPVMTLQDADRVYLINARGCDGVLVQTANAAYTYTVRNFYGEITETGRVEKESLIPMVIKDAYLCEFKVER